MRRSRGILLPLISLAGWAGCSSDEPDQRIEVAEGRPDPQDDFLGMDDGMPGASETTTEQPACLGETQQAEVIGLDIFVMLDISSSMLEALPGATLLSRAQTKWDAVKQSLEAFVQAPQSAEIGVGLQYFPQLRENVPFGCITNDECGGGGPCESALCITGYTTNDPPGPAPAVAFIGPAEPDCTDDCLCNSDADCPGDGSICANMLGLCTFPGQGTPDLPLPAFCNSDNDCSGIPDTLCEPFSICDQSNPAAPVFCLPSLGCPAGAGTCVPYPYRCINQTVCEADAYSVPAVAISAAANRTQDIISSLETVQLNGLTPTGPALRGALDQARAWKLEHPERQVITVLATDGLPTECTPLDGPGIAQLAAGANRGENPVRTFVIGVFSAGALGVEGRGLLDSLARAGGSDNAFVIDTSTNVADNFLRALNEIRDTAVSCEFQLDGQAALDFDRVNLRITDPGGASQALSNVGDASACGDDQGWYYTRNAEGTPTQIEVCPSTCAQFMTSGVSAELEIGCATRIR